MARTHVRIATLSLLAGLASLAHAQDDFRRPLNEPREQDVKVRGSSNAVMTQVMNGQSITVRMIDGTVDSVEVDGKPVPKSRYRTEGSSVVVLDEEGRELTRMIFALSGQRGPMVLRDLPLVFPGGGGAGGVTMIAPRAEDRPSVRMGIIMAPDIDDRKGVEVMSVQEDSPAAKAGLREGDVLQKADDKDLRIHADLLDVLRGKKAGDKLELTILRDGDTRTISVTLEQAPRQESVLDSRVEYLPSFDAAERELREAVQSLRAGGDLSIAQREATAARIERALASLAQAREQARQMSEVGGLRLDMLGERMGNWGEQFGERMGNWGERFGQDMGRWGEELGERVRREVEMMQRRMHDQMQDRAPQQAPRPNPPEQQDDAETLELREMLRAMQDRLDRLERRKGE